MRVTVLGATGRTGRELVPQLVAAGHDVTAVVRREAQLDDVGRGLPGVTGVLGDVEGGPHGDLRPAFDGADAVVWAIGATPADPAGHPERVRDGGTRAVAAAAEAGAGRWVQVSTMFANRPEQAPPPLVPAMRLKGELDDALRESGPPWTILRPGGLDDTPGTRLITVGAELPPMMISRADVAAVVVELVTTGAGHRAEFDLANGGTPIAEAIATL